MALDGSCDVVWNDRMTLMEGIFENLWTNTNILMDRSFKFHLIPQMACSLWPSFIQSLWNSLFFPTEDPNSAVKVFLFLHW